MGKHKSNYCPNIDCGDNFVVVNAKNIKMTGNKLEQKILYKHTGYPGGLKETSYKDILNSSSPEKLIKLSVKRMLPKGVLGREQFKKLMCTLKINIHMMHKNLKILILNH